MTHPFTDVPDGAYYADAVQWAYDAAITTGTTETTFSPDAPMTRAMAVTFLERYNAWLQHHQQPPVNPPAPDPLPDPEPTPDPPPPDPEPTGTRGNITPVSELVSLSGKWIGDTDGGQLIGRREGYVSVQRSGVLIRDYYKAPVSGEASTDTMVVVAYDRDIDGPVIEHAYLGGRPNRAAGKHVDTLQVWGNHTVSGLYLFDSIIEGSANAALMVKAFAGVLAIVNCEIRKNGQHCIRAHTDTQSVLFVRRSDIAQVSLEGDWTLDIDTATNIPGGVTLNGERVR